MSKAALKKELQTLDRDQLIEVLLNTYSASAGAKEYLEFFLNPDPTALWEKKRKTISKEYVRSKYGYSKMRVSVLDKALKEYVSFGVGPEYIARAALEIFINLLNVERIMYFSPTHVTATGRMLARYILESNNAGYLEDAMNQVNEIYRNRKIGREGFKAYMPSWFRTAMAQLPPDTIIPQVKLYWI